MEGLPRYSHILDGGYISFKYGTQSKHENSWQQEKHRYADGLIVMDGSLNYRYLLYPEYKQHRAQKAERDPAFRERRERVKAFRVRMERDTSVCSIKFDYFEADDLVALFTMAGLGVPVIKDKDLGQIEAIRPYLTTNRLHLPKYMQSDRELTGTDWVLIQAIRGDKSDNIPRLLSSSVSEAQLQWRHIMRKPEQSLLRAWRLYGQQFLVNVGLVLMPGWPLHNRSGLDPRRLPLSLSPKGGRPWSSTLKSLMPSVQSGEYWNVDNFSEFLSSVVWPIPQPIKKVENATNYFE